MHFHDPRRDPPTASPAEMRRLAVGVTVGVAAAAFALFFLVDFDIEKRKEDQIVERAAKDLIFAAQTIDHMMANNGGKPPEAGPKETLPPSFEKEFATMRGGAPFHKSHATYAARDYFSPGGASLSPLTYRVESSDWIILSRGPDLDLDIPMGALQSPRNERGIPEQVDWNAYDPTNGVRSSGDLWVSNIR